MDLKNKILLCGLDLDGTLLKNDKTISEFTERSLIAASRRGIRLVPVTGRPLSGVPECVTDLGVCDYAITTNGAVITDLKTGKRVYSAPIEHEKTVLLMKTLDESGISYEAFADGIGYLRPQLMARYNEKYGDTPIGNYIRSSRKVAKDPLGEFISGGKCADEIFISCENKDERNALAGRFGTDGDIQLCLLEDTFLEITRRGTDKGAAFLRLCSMLGIDRENTAVFGDNSNDVSLARAAGLFVAMDNAAEDFKARADVIAPSNENDGVAKIINKF